MTIYSSADQLRQIEKILCGYLRLPIAADSIPGSFMEAVLAHVRAGKQLATYDFVDVIQKDERVGWSIKSTKATTPLTWKRAKIANKGSLIEESLESQKGLNDLGAAILEFCNDHAKHSLEYYDLEAIGYARLILFPDGAIRYFERPLCTRQAPSIFDPSHFEWRWSDRRAAGRKEQLSALHGFHIETGERWWAWHGHGENQLHFTGERAWWPANDDAHAISFRFPREDERVSLEKLTELLEQL